MEHPLIQSLKAMDTRPVSKVSKNEPVFKEQFQAHLSKETKKQLTEKETSFKPEKEIDEDQDKPVEKEENQPIDFLFTSSILAVQNELSHALNLSVPEDQLVKEQDMPMGYIKTLDEMGIENGLEQTEPAQKEYTEKIIDIPAFPVEKTTEKEVTIPFAKEQQPKMDENKQVNVSSSVAVPEFDKNGSNQVIEPVFISTEKDAEVNVSKETGYTTVFDKLTTPRLLTKDWMQVKKPVEIEDAIEIEQLASSETEDSTVLIKQLDTSNSVLTSEDSLVGNEKLAILLPLEENEQQLSKSDDGESAIKLDGSAAIQKSTNEPIGIKVNNQDTIKQTFTHEVNQLISKEIEQIQLKGQSSAIVTISPEGMGDISISLELKDNVLSTKIIVDNLKIQELLTGGVPKLSDNLSRHSIQIGEVSIQLATADQNNSNFDQRQHKKELQAKINRTKGSFVESAPMKTVPEANGKSGRLSILV